jgi:hypothetical protein
VFRKQYVITSLYCPLGFIFLFMLELKAYHNIQERPPHMIYKLGRCVRRLHILYEAKLDCFLLFRPATSPCFDLDRQLFKIGFSLFVSLELVGKVET